MEIRHHQSPSPRKWTHYFWEFFMLFLAITAGYLVENWREHKIEHRKAKEFAKILKADLITDTTQLNRLITEKENLSNELKRMDIIIGKDHDKITFDDISFAGDNSADAAIFVPNDVAYSQMKNSGSLRFFQDLDLVNKLGKYDAIAKKLQNDWNEAKSYFVGTPFIIQFFSNTEKFIKKNPTISGEKLVAPHGFDFQGFDEATEIFKYLVWFKDGFAEKTYPLLKETAKEIISLLNKDYHL